MALPAAIREPRFGFRLAIPMLAALVLQACGGDLSALDPAGPAARSIASLWWAMLAGAAILFLLVIALFLLTLLRPGFGSRVTPRRWILWGGLAMPIPVLTLLLVYALFQGERLIPAAAGPDGIVEVEARARQWAWEFAYPGLPDATPTVGVLHIPAGRPVEVLATSADVIHSFWVPRLGGKMDATPGHVTRLRIEADQPGTYGGICAEFCGDGHADMRFRVVAHPPEDYEAALREAMAGAEDSR